MTQTFDIRDESGNIFNTVAAPAAVFSKDCGTLHKIGERADMENYFEVTQAAYRRVKADSIADELVLMDLPKDQDEIDKAFQNTGYIIHLYKRAIQS